MMRRLFLAALCVSTLGIGASFGDYLATQGAGTTFFDFICFATKHCPTATIVNSAGTELATSGAPLRVDPTGTTTQPVSVPTWAGGALGAMANYGTTPGAVLVPGVNAFITNVPAVTQSGTWTVQPTAATATITSTASSAASVQILASNAARKGAIFTNTDANQAFVKFGTAATATSFTVIIPPGGYWEMPSNVTYTGIVHAIWSAAGAGAIVATEM